MHQALCGVGDLFQLHNHVPAVLLTRVSYLTLPLPSPSAPFSLIPYQQLDILTTLTSVRGLTSTPPRLGVPLLLSTALWTTVIILHFFVVGAPAYSYASMIWQAFVATGSAYYLLRYFQRHAAINCAVLAGGDAWPVVPLFPGRVKHSFAEATGYGLFYMSISHSYIILKKRILSMWWPEGSASIVLVGAYILGLVASAVVYMQAQYVRKAEGNVLCAEAHEMQC
jgi:hypothetical protein